MHGIHSLAVNGVGSVAMIGAQKPPVTGQGGAQRDVGMAVRLRPKKAHKANRVRPAWRGSVYLSRTQWMGHGGRTGHTHAIQEWGEPSRWVLSA